MSRPAPPRSPRASVLLVALVLGLQRGAAGSTCPPPCVCSGALLDCSRLRRSQIPDPLPEWTVQL